MPLLPVHRYLYLPLWSASYLSIKKRSPLPPFAERAKRSWPGGSDSLALPSGAVTGGCGSRCPRAPFQLAPRSSCFCRSALGVRLGVTGGGPPNFRASEPGALPLGGLRPQYHPATEPPATARGRSGMADARVSEWGVPGCNATTLATARALFDAWLKYSDATAPKVRPRASGHSVRGELSLTHLSLHSPCGVAGQRG